MAQPTSSTTVNRPVDDADRAAAFIARWEASQGAERANYQLFLSELCDLIGVPRPEPAGADDRENAYVFERAVPFEDGDGIPLHLADCCASCIGSARTDITELRSGA